MRLIWLVTILLCGSPTLPQAHNLSTRGIFEDDAYGGSRKPVERQIEEEQYPAAPEPQPAVRPSESPPAQVVNLPPPLPLHKPQETIVPKKQPSPLPTAVAEVDAKAQNELAEKSLIARAYEIRRAEGKASWNCLHASAKEMLSHIEAKFGKVQLVSTCRPGATIAYSGLPSQHGSGRAIDFNPNERHSKKDVVTWLIANRKQGWISGIMTYANHSHIHVDCGHYRFVSLNARG